MATIATEQVRQRAIEACRSGKGTQDHIAKCFGITTRCLQKWLKAYREEGRTAPLPRGHNPAKFQGENLSKLGKYVKQNPDITLSKLNEKFAGRVTCTDATICNTLKRLDLNYKKNAAGKRTRQV